MDLWPVSNHGTQDKPNKQKAIITRGEEGDTDSFVTRGPVLSPGNGAATAAILRPYESIRPSTKKRMEWKFIAEKNVSLRVLPPRTLFPERRVNPRNVTQLSNHRRAEEGARFLRQRYPDIDIPFEIIKEYMDDDHAYQARYKSQPNEGNRLAFVHSHNAPRDRQIAFVFPVPGQNNQLNVSSSSWSRSRGAMLNIAPSPVATFDTPILQVASSTYNHREEVSAQDLPTFSVRTMSFCALFSVNFSPLRSIHSQPSINQVFLCKYAETGAISHISTSPFTPSRVLLVNATGAVTLMQADNTNAELVDLDSTSNEESSWRVCWGNEENIALRASSNRLDLLDIRGGPATRGLNLAGKEKFAGLEARPSNLSVNLHLVTVATNKRVIWLDDRYLTTPLLSWEHNRADDLTLATSTYTLGQKPITCLTSQNNGLVTMYDTSVSSGRIYSNGIPQAFQFAAQHRKYLGHAFYQHPASEAQGANLVAISENGGIFATEIIADAGTQTRSEIATGSTHQWPIISHWNSHDLAAQMSPDIPEALSLRESFEVDFHRVYQELRQRLFSKFTADEDVDQIRDILETMPRVWDEFDQPLETVMTMQDVALRASSEPGHVARADFLTSTPINSQRAKAAFQDGHLAISGEVGKGSAWSYDISRCINLIHKVEPRATEEETHFVTYDRKQHDMATLLNIDLSLGNDIYAAVPFRQLQKAQRSATIDDEVLRRAAQSMSISNTQKSDPPPLFFSFLNPRPQTSPLEGKESDQLLDDPMKEIEDASTGIRHLLSDWELGSDPTQFQYVNPYPDIEVSGVTTAPRKDIPREPILRPSPQIQLEHSSMPPKIGLAQNVASMAILQRSHVSPETMARASTPIRIATQIQPSRVDLATRSQDPDFLGTSTQILPGKHGGRSKGGSKKTKKRMGGF